MTLADRLKEDPIEGVTVAPTPPLCEANVFATSPAGFSVHFKVVSPFDSLVPLTEGLLIFLQEGEYTAGGPRAGASGQAAEAKADGPECAFCGSPSSHGVSKKGNPYLKCSNKSCNAVAPYQDRKTGEWVWKEDSPR